MLVRSFIVVIVLAMCAMTAWGDELPRLAFVGLHGGVFESLERFAPEVGVEVEYIVDERIASKKVDFSKYRMVFLQHVREEDRQQYEQLIARAKAANSELRVISISEISGGMLANLERKKIVEHDPDLLAYYGSSSENLRRLLRYVGVKYLRKSGEAPPPLANEGPQGLYHPDRDGMFKTVADFISWAKQNGKAVDGVPRAVVAVHSTHLAFQQPEVVDTLVCELEEQGALAVAMVDGSPTYLEVLKELKPEAVIHTCHSGEGVSQREELDAVHLHSIFFRKQAIDDWRASIEGLAANELAFHVVGQELLGAIEPQIGSGTASGGGSAEAFTPVPERIEHLAARTMAWMRLARLANSDKKVAMVYYDREMGKSELMRGSATGMFMNGARSMVKVLGKMKEAGYRMRRVPQDEDELLLAMQDHGRQIGIWLPGELDRLARSGQAVLVPVEEYEKWFETKVPPEQREAVIKRWGPPPGKFLTWENQGRKFIVIPRIDYGNVILLPQPLRGEAHDTSLLHDKLVPPPHNYLATYFWLQEGFQANALIHFGTHGSEFALPGKPSGLSDYDWPDIVMGTMPNINPWIVNNLGESSSVRRRAYAVIIDHLTPPLVNAELSDELLNLHNDIDHWVAVPDGALKHKFAASITEQVKAQHLDKDLKLALEGGPREVLTGEQIERVLEYLHAVHNETTPVSLHVFGESPRENLLIPYLVTCLRKEFLESLDEIVDVPAEEALNDGDRLKYLRRTAENALKLIIRKNYTPEEALLVVARIPSDTPLPEGVQAGCRLAKRLMEGFARTSDEIANLLRALDGGFISPGSGNSPDRNPGVLPTGRNMFVLNPEEVPARASWELGKQLVDQLLAEQLKTKGRHPERIGFTLSCFATFQDFGVMEAQILYLLGVRPVWDEQNLVVDVELIPLEELGRPRIDVFIAGHSYYRDLLPTRMKLLDQAIRLAGSAEDEPEGENAVLRHSRNVAKELTDRGADPAKAKALSRARIFGYPPGQNGSASYYYLVERSGEWDSREELMRTYLAHVQYVYTDGMWGEEAPEAYERQIQGTELVLRSWSDSTTSPLSNKYTWYHGGSLCMAVQHLTGKSPEFILSDLRDADAAELLSAEDALRKDYRVRLFNRKWIEGMMKEGYAGADQISVHVSNTMGWQIMRPESVSDDLWEEIVNIYLKDSKDLSIRDWFEAENPFALQEIHEILLESIRKGYWKASQETLSEIARGYAALVARHGEGGGLRGGGNEKLEAFVRRVLKGMGTSDSSSLVEAYENRAQETKSIGAKNGQASPAPFRENLEQVAGKKLEPKNASQSAIAADERTWWGAVVTVVCIGLIVVGYVKQRRGK